MTMSLVDMRINVDEFVVPRVSVGHRRSNSLPFSPFGIMETRSSNCSFSYTKLPEEPLKLTVLKLDGSSFDIEVMKSATVAELRHAVEAVFSHMPGKISWPHVWGHFCLCYDGQKLITETDYIRDYGIRDADQLQFIRHISTNYNPTRKPSMKLMAISENHRKSLSRSNSHEENENDSEETDCYDDLENGGYWQSDEMGDIVEVEQDKVRVPRFLRPWFAYSSLPNTDRRRSLKASPSRSSCGFLYSFRKIIQFCADDQYSQKDSWRED